MTRWDGRSFRHERGPNIDSEGRLTGVVGTSKTYGTAAHEEQPHHGLQKVGHRHPHRRIAHDFKNMLHTMSGYNQILLRKHGAMRTGAPQQHSDSPSGPPTSSNSCFFFSRRLRSRPQRLDLNREIQAYMNSLYRTKPRMIASDELSSRPCIAYATRCKSRR